MSRGAPNLLILSDLHLGGALRPPIRFGNLRVVARLDRELRRFLDYHRAHPQRDEAGRHIPWTLVLNGDNIDFLHVDLRPSEEHPEAPDEDEQLYGLAFAEERSRWKLGQIARYHRRAFRALAQFVEAGNRVVFVVGNHDADLFFRGVRQDLVEHIAARADEPEAVRGRITFCPWFYFEEGRVYVEHGHRFDPYATFPDPLTPHARDRRELEPTFGHWGLRYFCNRVRSFPIHDVDTWTAADFIRWARARNPLTLVKIFLQAVAFVWRYVRATARHRVDAAGYPERRRKRRERLEKLARAYKMPFKRVAALDRLRQPHIGGSLLHLAQALYLDRGALVVLFTLSVAWAFGAVSSTMGALALTGLAAGLTVVAWRWLGRLRPDPDCHSVLERMALRIGRLTGAPIVVFGHTHRPVLARFGRTHWLNPGSWEHMPRRRFHRSAEPCNCGARFGIITGAAGSTRARLMGWCRRHEAPQTL